MTGEKSKWIYRSGIGCLVLLTGGAVTLGILWVVMTSLTDRAVETRQALDDAHASQETYTPPLDESIPADRMRRFLAVRTTLMPYCEMFSAHRDVFGRLKDHEEAEEEPEAGEFFESVRLASSTLWSMGRDVGEYAITRNEVLLENGLGLGEYTWIYVIAYFSWLGESPVDLVMERDGKTKIFHGRILGEIRNMMQRHTLDLEAELETSTGLGSKNLQARLSMWRGELDRLNNDENRVPFQNGLPPELEASLEPFRSELERVYCQATSELEIMHTVDTGLWYDHQ